MTERKNSSIGTRGANCRGLSQALAGKIGELCSLNLKTARLKCYAIARKMLQGSFSEPVATNVERMLWMLDAAPNLGSISSAPPLSLSKFPGECSYTFSVGGTSTNWPRLVFRPLRAADTLEEVEGICVLEVQGERQ